MSTDDKQAQQTGAQVPLVAEPLADPAAQRPRSIEGESIREALRKEIEKVIGVKVPASDAVLMSRVIPDPDAQMGFVCLPVRVIAELDEVRAFTKSAADAEESVALVMAALARSTTLAVLPGGVVRTVFKRHQRNTVIIRDVAADVSEEEIIRELFPGQQQPLSAKREINGWWFVTLASEDAARSAFEALGAKKLRGETVKARIKTGAIVRDALGQIASAPTAAVGPAPAQLLPRGDEYPVAPAPPQLPAPNHAPAATPVFVALDHGLEYVPQQMGYVARYPPPGSYQGVPASAAYAGYQGAYFPQGYIQPQMYGYYPAAAAQQQQFAAQYYGGGGRVPAMFVGYEGGGRRGEGSSKRGGMRSGKAALSGGIGGQQRRRMISAPPVHTQPQLQGGILPAPNGAYVQPQVSLQGDRNNLRVTRNARRGEPPASQAMATSSRASHNQPGGGAALQSPRQAIPPAEAWAELFPPLPTSGATDPQAGKQPEGYHRDYKRYTRDDAIRVISGVMADGTERPATLPAESSAVLGSPVTTLESSLAIVQPHVAISDKPHNPSGELQQQPSPPGTADSDTASPVSRGAVVHTLDSSVVATQL